MSEEERKLYPHISNHGWKVIDTLKPWIDDGKPLEERLAEKTSIMESEGIQFTSAEARMHMIIGMGLRPREWGAPVGEPDENLLTLSCYPGMFSQNLMAFSRLVDRLGGKYTILPKEYCCGNTFTTLPTMRRDKVTEVKWRDTGDRFPQMNIAEAKRLGVKRMYHACLWCVYHMHKDDGDSDVEQKFHLDLIVELMAKAKPKLQLNKTVAYYEGCGTQGRIYSQGSKWDLDWASYRALLNNVEGLTVIDMPKYCCVTHLDKTINFMKEKKVDTVVTPCPTCRNMLELGRPLEPKIAVRTLSQLLLEALQD